MSSVLSEALGNISEKGDTSPLSEVRRLLLLMGWEPPTLNTEINIQDSYVPRSTHSPSPSALTWHFLCLVSCSFFLMQCG